jgi:hypothetical protein
VVGKRGGRARRERERERDDDGGGHARGGHLAGGIQAASGDAHLWIRRFVTTSWILSIDCPGVAERARMRKPPDRAVRSLTACVYAWLPDARWASSTTTHTIDSAGHTPLCTSFTSVWGVRKSIRAVRHASALASALICPVSSANSASGCAGARATDGSTHAG